MDEKGATKAIEVFVLPFVLFAGATIATVVLIAAWRLLSYCMGNAPTGVVAADDEEGVRSRRKRTAKKDIGKPTRKTKFGKEETEMTTMRVV